MTNLTRQIGSAESGAPGIEDEYPLAPSQAGTLFHAQLELAPGSSIVRDTYLYQCVRHLRGRVDAGRLKASFEQVLARHSALRTAFRLDGALGSSQVVTAVGAVPFQVIEAPGNARDEALEAFLREDRLRGIDLCHAPLFRITLLRFADDDWTLVWTYYMAIDNWSRVIAWNEVVTTYAARGEGQVPELVTPVPFRSYIDWLGQQDHEAAKLFWREELRDLPDPTPIEETLRSTLLGHPQSRGAGGIILEDVSAEVSQRAVQFARSQKMTMFSLFQGLWGLLLHRYTQQRDLVWAVEYAVRPPELDNFENIVGFFVNAVPMRARIDPNSSVESYLSQVNQGIRARQKFQYSGALQIQEAAGIRNIGKLLTSMVATTTMGAGELRSAGNEFEVVSGQEYYPNHWAIICAFLQRPRQTMQFQTLFDPRVFDKSSVSRLHHHLQTLLRNVVEHPSQPIKNLELVPEEERHRTLVSFNDTKKTLPYEQTLHAPFEEQARRTPNSIAVIASDGTLTYEELDKRANRLARVLQKRGVGPECCVGVRTLRTTDMVIATIAVLKAGGAYVPLPAELPEARIANIVEDTRLTLVLSSPEVAGGVFPPGIEELALSSPLIADENAGAVESPALPHSLAYVIFTSGSTGRPKGVEIEHAAALNTVLDVNARLGVGAGDRVLALSSLAFDLSVYDIFGLLAAGGTIVIGDVGDRDPAQWVDSVVQHNVTLWNSVPALLEMAVEYAKVVQGSPLRSLRGIMMSGDWIPVDLPGRIRNVAPNARQISMGGATEGSIWSVWYPIEEVQHSWSSIPYGRPMANQRWYVLDDDQRPLPIGVAGDLYIGGIGVARGYRARDELSRERFVTDPFVTNGRMYKTGDRGRWLPDGNLEFLGRLDSQVKISGYRIELGEIEAHLLRAEGVRDAAAIVYVTPAGERALAAVVVPRGDACDVDALRSGLKLHLPAYMVPNTILATREIALTENGKVDRKALAELVKNASLNVGGDSLPRDDVERRLVEIWTDLLETPNVGIHDDFFALGGHSLRATQMIARVNEEFGVALPVSVVFHARTASDLGGVIREEMADMARANAAS
jgi:amino acid adenylation domain-containing protein